MPDRASVAWTGAACRFPLCPGCMDEILHVRHHRLFVPRDVSPYFEVVKPTLACSFDHRALHWPCPQFDR